LLNQIIDGNAHVSAHLDQYLILLLDDFLVRQPFNVLEVLAWDA